MKASGQKPSAPLGRDEVHGEIPIVVNPTDTDAPDTINLEVAMSNCGFSYIQGCQSASSEVLLTTNAKEN
jgi:hypothetical protein